jgi:hypothetical protein
MAKEMACWYRIALTCPVSAANKRKRAPAHASAALQIITCLYRYLQQKRASKRGDGVAGDSDDDSELGSLILQVGATGGRAASPPLVITTTTTLSKSGQANKCVLMP